MVKNYENKSMTEDERLKKEAEYMRLISEAERDENYAEAKRLKAERRRELRGASRYPPEPVGMTGVKILDARNNRGAPTVLYDPAAPPEPMMMGNVRVVPSRSQEDRWKR